MGALIKMDKKKKIKNNTGISNIILTVLFLIIGLGMLLPLLWMISSSFKMESDIFNFPIEWIPKRWNAIENYKTVWGNEYNFGLYYFNSIKIAVLATFFQVLFSALGAYGFTKISFKGRDTLFIIYLATMMIPEQVTVVSRFIILQKMGLYNTHLGIILMLSFSVYGVFLLRQNMLAIPNELSESAKIDGASHFRIFFQIILPLLKPSIATLAILKFVWTWNDYQTPLVFLNSEKLYTIQLGMQQFASQSGVYYSLIMAAAVSSILPLMVIFIIGQKYVIDGITSGAVKG